MKIAFVTTQVVSRHATMKRAAGMAPLLAAKGHSVHVLVERHPDNEEAFRRDDGVHAHFFAGRNAGEERIAKWGILRRIRPDVTHICGLGWRNSLRRNGVVGVSLIDHVELESANRSSRLARRIRQWLLERWSVHAFEGCVVASRFLEAWAINRGKARGRVLYLPYAHETGCGQRAGRMDWRERFGGRRIVLYSGGWCRNYGFYEMLRAGRELLGRRDDFVLVMTGRGPEDERGRNWVRRRALENHVFLLGYLPVDELESLMRASDVFLSPLNDSAQDWARCPSKMFLYMQHRRPIVTAFVGEGLEYFTDHRFHHHPGDSSGMADAIDRALRVDGTWRLNYDPTRHTWRQRVVQWERWVLRNWGKRGPVDGE